MRPPLSTWTRSGRTLLEQPGVVGDDEHGPVGTAQALDTFRDGPEGVDVEPRVGLVEDGEPGLEQGQSGGPRCASSRLPRSRAFTDRLRRAGSISRRAMCSLARARNSMAPISGCRRSRRRAFSAVRRKYMLPTPGISTGYWKARKSPAAARCSGVSAEQVDTVERDRAGHVVPFPPGQDVRQRALARPVRAHDRVDLARADVEVEPVEDASFRRRRRSGRSMRSISPPPLRG